VPLGNKWGIRHGQWECETILGSVVQQDAHQPDMTTLDSRSMATLACRQQLEKDEELILSGEWLGKGTYARVRKAYSKKIGAE